MKYERVRYEVSLPTFLKIITKVKSQNKKLSENIITKVKL